MTDHRHRVRVWCFVFLGHEGAAQCRTQSKRVEEVPRHYRTGDQIGLIVVSSAHGDARVSEQITEHFILVAIINVVGIRGNAQRTRPASVEDEEESVRPGYRQWSEQRSVDDAEDRSVRADAQRQREHCYCGESGTRAQNPQAVTKVLPQGFHSYALWFLFSIFYSGLSIALAIYPEASAAGARNLNCK